MFSDVNRALIIRGAAQRPPLLHDSIATRRVEDVHVVQ